MLMSIVRLCRIDVVIARSILRAYVRVCKASRVAEARIDGATKRCMVLGRCATHYIRRVMGWGVRVAYSSERDSPEIKDKNFFRAETVPKRARSYM